MPAPQQQSTGDLDALQSQATSALGMDVLNAPPSAVQDAQNRIALRNVVQGGGQARPQLADQTQATPAQINQAGGPLNFFKSALQRFTYGASQAGMKAAGLPTDLEQLMAAAQIEHLHSQSNYVNAQAQAMHTMVPMVDAWGHPMSNEQGQPIMIPQAAAKFMGALLGRSYGAQVSGQYGMQKQGLANQGALDTANAKRTPQAELGQRFLEAVNNGDADSAANALQQLQSLSAAGAKPKAPGDFGQYYSKFLADNGLEDTAQSMLSARKQWDTHPMQPGAQEARDAARGDRSYQFHSGQLDKLGTPIDAAVSRLGRLNDTLAQNSPQADALVAPELLTVMAGGQGSGLRMNEAEIARIVGGRSVWESLKASINRWSTDPNTANSITPAQRQQIHALVNEVNRKLLAKQSILDGAREQLINTDDPIAHRGIYADARKRLSDVDKGAAAQAPTQQPGAPSQGGQHPFFSQFGGQAIQ